MDVEAATAYALAATSMPALDRSPDTTGPMLP
jgi:hypothetical protein